MSPVIGGGESGTEAAATAEKAGKRVLVLDAEQGDEVVGIYPGPLIVVRTPTLMLHVYPTEIIVATGAAEIHPAVPGTDLEGVVDEAGPRSGCTRPASSSVPRVAIGTPPPGVPCIPVAGQLIRIEGDGRGHVRGVVTADDWIGAETATPCDTLIVGLGFAPRDVLVRMAGEVPISGGRTGRRSRGYCHLRRSAASSARATARRSTTCRPPGTVASRRSSC
jgi:NADPH-dependent 2,4-dienoyl-CoA reductase/sulfur reductase-like enzyme